MNSEFRKEILKLIEVTKESMQNCMQISLESYVEILSKLDLLTHLIISENTK